MNTVSISIGDKGLAEAVKTAASLKGKGQKAPYTQGNVDWRNKDLKVRCHQYGGCQ